VVLSLPGDFLSKMTSIEKIEMKRPEWPDDSPMSGASYERVNGTISCVLTRFRVPSFWSLPLFFLAFRRVRKQALTAAPGLIKAVFLMEGLRTYYTLSLWTNDNAIVDFSTHVTSHVKSANWAIVHVFRKDIQRPEIWSTHWRLWAISHNLNWEGVEMREVLSKQLGKSIEEIGYKIHLSAKV
jgi:hypothetical protein